MNILYVSSTCPPSIFKQIFAHSKVKPSQAFQKYHRLLIKGLAYHPDKCNIQALSSLPVSPSTSNLKYFNPQSLVYDGVKYSFIPLLNIKILKHILVFCITFFRVLIWNLKTKGKSKVVICDILNTTTAWSSILASRLISGKVAVVVTDLPDYLYSSNKFDPVKHLFLKVNNLVLKNFDFHIGLTAQMNGVINSNSSPFFLLEGLVDYELNFTSKLETDLIGTKKIILYAGGLYKSYGIDLLVNSFMKIDLADVELHIYGDGDFVQELLRFSKIDKRIHYYGVVENDEIVQKLPNVTLLVNPRPTFEMYTHFSFPSKNLEFMASGTPLLTTKLAGIPAEYLKYVYLIENETEEGIVTELLKLLSKPNNELFKFGHRAREYVLTNKSNMLQAQRLIYFFESNYDS